MTVLERTEPPLFSSGPPAGCFLSGSPGAGVEGGGRPRRGEVQQCASYTARFMDSMLICLSLCVCIGREAVGYIFTHIPYFVEQQIVHLWDVLSSVASITERMRAIPPNVIRIRTVSKNWDVGELGPLSSRNRTFPEFENGTSKGLPTCTSHLFARMITTEERSANTLLFSFTKAGIPEEPAGAVMGVW